MIFITRALFRSFARCPNRSANCDRPRASRFPVALPLFLIPSFFFNRQRDDRTMNAISWVFTNVMKVESTAIVKHAINFNYSRPNESKISFIVCTTKQIYEYELTQYAVVMLYYVISFNIKDINRYHCNKLLTFGHISKTFAYWKVQIKYGDLCLQNVQFIA